MSQKKYDCSELSETRKSWTDINEDSLNQENLQIFRARKRAVDLYIDGKSLRQIENVTEIKYSAIMRLVERCLVIGKDGIWLGYSGLIPNKRTKEYERKVYQENPDGNFSGSFEKLMRDYPDVRDEIIGIYTGKKKLNGDSKITVKNLHKRMLNLLKKEGLTETDYPFNTKTKGLSSLREYIKKMEDNFINDSINR